MHFRLTTFASLAAFAAVAVHAAPMQLMPEPVDFKREVSLETRALDDTKPEARSMSEELDLELRDFLEGDLDLRDLDDEAFDLTLREFLEELEGRGKPGWGLRKQPKSATFKTPSATYSGDEVNKAAKDALKKAEAGQKDRGYPKPGSGFRKSEAKADPTKGKGESYHAPLRKKGAPYPGPDRVVVNKKDGKTKFSSSVAHHDPKKPVPQGTGAKSNPFSGGKQKFNGKGRTGRKKN